MSENSRYYYDIRGQNLSIVDEEGCDFSSLQAAQTELSRGLFDVAKESFALAEQDFTAVLRDEAGNKLSVMTLSIRCTLETHSG